MPDNPAEINGKARDNFTKTKNIAMLGGTNQIRLLLDTPNMNWDMAQYPSYKDLPNKYGMVDTHVIGVSRTSKHKDAVMKVIEALTSDEIQLAAARSNPAASPLKNPEIKKQFGADIPELKGKNTQGIFKSSSVVAPAFSLYHDKAVKFVNAKSTDFALGKLDLNTALREADEEINKMLAEQKK
jgi:multiple sugar transport system substrate-binding protein